MKREILFRGKGVNDGNWLYGYYLKYTDIVGEVTVVCPLPEEGKYYDIEDCYVDPATVGQFTGLTDKNGVKIFEGDKLYCEAQLDKAEMYVVFEEGQFRMVLCDKFKEYETGRGYYDINSFQKTVIGNIHDTPALLKEESE